jgi:hypothetical protein
VAEVVAPPADKQGKSFFAELLLGLKTRSLAAWIGTLVFCAIELAACLLFFEPRRLARLDPRLLMETPNDEDVELSFRLLRLRTRTLDKIQVGYLGASQMARAIIDLNHPDKLGRYLSERSGVPVEFDMLASAGQRFEDALAITDQFPPTFRGVLVMGVNDYKDDYRITDQIRVRHRLARILVVDAPSVLPFWKQEGYVPKRTGVFFWDHLDFFAARRIAALRLSRVGPSRAVLLDEKEIEPNSARRGPDNPDRAPPHLPDRTAPILAKSRRVMVTLLGNMRRRGVPVVFVENPEPPIRTARNLPRVERFHREFAAFAARYGCPYWDFNPELALTEKDFPDEEHLGSFKGRRAFQKRLVDELGAFIRDRFAAGAAPSGPLDPGDLHDADGDERNDAGPGDDAPDEDEE